MKNYLTKEVLESVGATQICTIKNGQTVGYVEPTTFSEPGFYFAIRGSMPTSKVAARFYVGRTRNGAGFNSVLGNIRSDRSYSNRTMHYDDVQYKIYFVPASKMKPLTTGYGKGQLAMAFTKRHNDEFQNLTEMNRMLADNFIFTLQSY